MQPFLLHLGMRAFLLIFFFFFFYINSFSQKVTYKDLIGTWDLLDTTQTSKPLSINIMDSSNALMSINKRQKLSLTYILNTPSNPRFIQFKGESLSNFSEPLVIYYIAKIIDNHIIKLQGCSLSKSKWNYNENAINTAIMVKRK
jgi:hypothetical protein